MLSPILQAMSVPTRIRIILIILLSLSLVSGMNLQPSLLIADIPSLVAASLTEALIGAILAFGIFVAFAVFSFAGNVLDLQIGFSLANTFDPITRSQSPLLASTFDVVAVALFFTMDVHHTVLRGLAYSFEQMPLGSLLIAPSPIVIAREFGTIFMLGLVLIAPALFCLFLVDLSLAVMSRNLPQLNILFLSTPIKIVVGLTILAYTVGHFGTVAKKIFDSVFVFWDKVL
jgi:flagellar biosynthesis protein FliR